jgi:hypothetical protein
MHQQNIIFESSPAYIIVCIVLALGFAFLLYKTKHPWSKTWNRILFGARAVLAFLLAFLLLGPIVKQINNIFEKPFFVVLYDNSVSVREAVDSTTLANLQTEVNELSSVLRQQGYDVKVNDLAGEEIETPDFEGQRSDITGALKRIANRYEGSRIGGVALVSDGIYNSGISPLYSAYNFPVYTVGIGDTMQHIDVAIKNISYNKIAYQGNKFPLRVEVIVKNLKDSPINATVVQRGKVVDKQTKVSKDNQLLVFDFQPLASEQGIQKVDIQLEVKEGEYNTQNNRASVFVEVVEGKKKILVIASAPHPDIKALREVVEKNSNYEFILHTPTVNEQAQKDLRPDEVDLAIFYQSPDLRGRTSELFEQFASSRTSLLLILGQNSDLRLIEKKNMPVKFDGAPRDFDEVTPVINTSFSNFIVSPETNTMLVGYPPVSVHFGKVSVSLGASPLLFQRVGSVSTEKPLLAVTQQEDRKIGIMLGEGIWRWKLNEYDRTESSAAFDELFGKLIQYLSTSDDKRKFRSYPLQQEFSDSEPVIFESQVYNSIFEPVYGNSISLEITDEQGKKRNYSYTTSPGNSRYQIGDLTEGVYRYRARTTLEQKQEEVRGEFAVVKRQTELQNLTADFDLLKALSRNTGGKFFNAANVDALKTELQKTQAKTVIHSEESYDTLINLKWVFLVLLLLATFEWTFRKYFGSY